MTGASDDEGSDTARLVHNRARCRVCGDVVESRHVHDLRFCGCRRVGVDGGLFYLRRLGRRDDREEMSVWEEVAPAGQPEEEG